MKQQKITLKVDVWLYPSEKASWHFITIPKKESEKITKQYSKFKKGWGSLPVLATIGTTSWNTSIFPDSKSSTYLLPIKALIRRKEDIESGDTVTCSIVVQP